MTKVLAAECENGQVQIESKDVDATVLGQGTKSSTGVAIIDGPEVTYIPNRVSDLEDLIQKIADVLGNVATVLTSHDGALGGSQSATIALITQAQTELTTMKENLK